MASIDFPRLTLRDLFDADFYRSRNPDIANLNDRQAFSHFENQGVYEENPGRQFSLFFDLDFYLSNNPDVNVALGANRRVALEHFLNTGIFEGRPFSNLFNLDFYRRSNPDLAELDNSELFNHFLTVGLNEGRRFTPLVDLNFYRATNPDLAGLSNKELFNQFITFGINEGRSTVPLVDLDFYQKANPDLQNLSNAELVNHFNNSGLAEGRRFSPFFDVRYYLFNNPDLGVAGLNFQQAFEHFQNVGLDEGRRFSQFFDVNYYLANNPDLRAAGFGPRQAFQHFINYGLAEGRRPSLIFNPVYYLANNPDLAAQQLTYREAFEDFQVGDPERGRPSGLELGRRSSVWFDPSSMAALITADFQTATVIPDSVLKPTVKWNVPASGILTYSFVTTASAFLYEGTETGVRELDQGTKNVIRTILQQYSQYIPVTFVEVPDRPPRIGQLRFMYSDGPEQSGAGAYAYFPFDPGDSALPYPTPSIGGDVHLNPRFNFSAGPGAETYETLLHEIGHALGLKHPGPYDPEPTGGDQPPFLSVGKDNNTNTVMTYNSNSSATNYNGAFASTPMLDDIRTLQFLYGATYANNGDSVYSLNSTNFFGVKQTLWDSGGSDLLDFSALPALQNDGYYFDMNEGGHNTTRSALNTASYYYFGFRPDPINPDDPNSPLQFAPPYRTDLYGTNIAFGSEIENLFGSQGDDEILGNDLPNLIAGAAGNDIIIGGRAPDTFVGGAGQDIFALALGDGGPIPELADKILDFTPGEDRLGLSLGLGLGTIIVTPGVNPNDTLIRVAGSGEYLALLSGVPSTAISAANFTSI